MESLAIIADDSEAESYLRKHDLLYGFVPLEAVILQREGTSGGLPCALLIAEVGGKKVLIKTSLRLLLAATNALNARTKDELGEHWIGP